MQIDDNYCINIISDAKNISNEQVLLYECYIRHFAWEITHSNPSNIRIEHVEGLTLLADDYDSISVWFSIKNKDKLLACARICFEDESNLLEVERYSNAKEFLQPILKQKNFLKIVELNREAILASHVHEKKICLLLLKAIFEYCFNNNYSILTTSNIPEWVDVYKIISFNNIPQYTFKYFDSDPSPVLVYFATPPEIKKLIQHIEKQLLGEII